MMDIQFLTKLVVEETDDDTNEGRGTWRLKKRLAYISHAANGLIVVPAGFVTDFASVPRIPIVWLLCGDTAHPAAALHDWIYTTCPMSRRMADDVLREAAICKGVPKWRAFLLWAGVRIFGASHWEGRK